MSRKSLGIVAALLLTVGVFVWLRGPEGGSGNAFAFGCIRVGLVVGAGWLAYPQIVALIRQSPRWVLSWFIGNKSKTSASTGTSPTAGASSGKASPMNREPARDGGDRSPTAASEEPRPAPRVLKPRRRSNS
jgi:hypothetical protein